MRPDPNKILEKIKTEKKDSNCGKLKIFFGYAAGVGKTYSMLEAAHKAFDNGNDVVIGYIEPHARPETMALTNGIESLDNKKIEYNGIILKEFDLDAALKRNPEIILVDELAHTNAMGSRHVKRYQDIEELLNAGINVYTTVNVQHIESLNDIVESITGIEVRERIPDRIFDLAYQVELVDIEPEDLIDRLNKGKIYRRDRAVTALDNFFTVDNLTALREIALRRCADRVNKISEKIKNPTKNSSPSNEHILICLSASPSNKKVIRTASRMADAFKGTFTALYVETSDDKEISEEDEKRLNENFKLAEQLGANITTVYGDDIVFQIAEFARLSNVSKIVIGRSGNKRGLFSSNSSFANKLSSIYPNLDIYIIPDSDVKNSRNIKNIIDKEEVSINFMDTIKSIAILFLCTAAGFIFYSLGFSEANIITVYILGVLGTAVLTPKKIYPIVSSLLSVLIFNFFFTVPRFTLDAYDKGYPVTFLIMFIAAFVTGTLTSKIKEQAKQSARVAYRTKVLLETNQRLQQAKNKEDIIEETGKQILKLLDKTTIIYLSIHDRLLEPRIFKADINEDIKEYINANEQAVALWVYKNNKHAGVSTNTLNGSKCYYLSIRGKEGIYGVVGVKIDNDEEFSMFDRSLLISMVNECGSILENNYLEEKNEKTLLEAKQEKLRANLLRSISHDLRTPLTSISGNASVLLKDFDSIDENKKHALYEDMYDDSMWLINLVENLLSVTRIEDGSMNLNIEPELINEVILESLKHINRKSVEHNIKVENDDELLMAKMDSRLIMQVIINIVDNAIKYTKAGSDIIIRVKKKNGYVYTSIMDNGDGISEEGKKNLFKMFYTGGNIADSRRGLGLGLYLCKTIINAHGGELTVKDNTPKGTIFTFSLRAQEVTLYE
ncbi:sensor histidine kinase [Anaerofustis stercorihominis]|uniref:sensor histidine kinase n=1 Tax=Anaerofustis stercorihominis TaxID=214853 RepID=UPI00214AF353|nr:sensor histidine kinase KdpD [Anaerofustis stercorihominis]MCR2032492.1 sensor histidine kinase KdpD [Anaerofustis stercorihominis]